MYSDSSSKSEIFNKQFQSVFTKKSTTATPRLFGNKYPAIGNLSITLKGVQRLLEKINISKAAGPDLIPGRMHIVAWNSGDIHGFLLHYISIYSSDLLTFNVQ